MNFTAIGNSIDKIKAEIHFCFEDIDTRRGKVTDLFVIFLIFLSTAIFVVRTYSLPLKTDEMLACIEEFIVCLFVIEYLLRFWTAPSKKKYFFSVYSFIDLMAIVPAFFSTESVEVLRFFRSLRILRMIRFLQGKNFFFINLEASHIIILKIIYIIITIVLVSSDLIFFAEHTLPGTKINTFTDAVYFSIVTLTTVGFGDITPISNFGRFVTILIILSGIMFIPWQVKNLMKQLMQQSTQVADSCKVCPTVYSKIARNCQTCATLYHDEDALFCKICGHPLNGSNHDQK